MTTAAPAIAEQLQLTLKKLNLTASEYQKIAHHLKREPNMTELAMFSVLWSEHCCYKNSRHLLRKFPNKSPRVVAGPGENAGVIDIGDNIQIAFKIESHNHPTAVEPFQGATTGVGGILRDIFTMNARPIANLNSLRFGPQNGASAENKRNRFLFKNAVKGIAHYGNCVGVPTIGGEVFFDPSYTGNPLVNAMAIGILYDNNITSAKVHGIGNPILYVGNATGKDGMGGAAFASKELDEKSQDDRPAVQVGDPFSEKILIEACLEAFATGCVVAAQDMGAAGLTSSSCEMAAKGGVGMRMDLDKVPAREPNMQAVEYLLSESQERMLFVLEKGKEQPVLDVFAKWHIPAVIIGEVIGTAEDGEAHIEIYRHGEKAVDLPAVLLTDLAPDYDRGTVPPEPETAKARRLLNPHQTPEGQTLPDITWQDVPQWLEQMMASENIASPKAAWQQYDRHVQNGTLLSSENLTAGVIRIRDKDGQFSKKAIAATTDCNARYVYLEPFSGSMSAMAESVRNLACVAAEPMAITDNLNFGNPEKPEIYYQLYYGVQGIADACKHFDLPVISGNVSLYNEFKGQAILPAPVVGTVGLIENIDDIQLPTASFQQAGDKIALVGRFKPTLGGSEYQYLRTESIYANPPEVALKDEKQLAQTIRNWVRENRLSSVQDVSVGGLLPTITESLFIKQLGAKLDLGIVSGSGYRIDEALFGETNGSYIISFKADQEDALKASLPTDCAFTVLGETTDTGKLELSSGTQPVLHVELSPLKDRWQTALA